jgi:hypothetical protein
MGPSQVADGCRGSAPAPIGWARRPSGGRTRELAWTERPTPPPGKGASTPIARNHPSRPGRPRHLTPTRPGTTRALHRPACWTPSAPARPHSRRRRHRPPTTAARASESLRHPRPTRRVRSIAPPLSRTRLRLPPRPLGRRWASQSRRSVPLQTRTPRTTRAPSRRRTRVLSRRSIGAQEKVGRARAQWSRATRSRTRPPGRVGGDQTVQVWMRPAERLGRCRRGARRRRLPRSLRRPFPNGNPRRCQGRPLPAVPRATGPLRPPHATRNQIAHHSRPPATGSAPHRRSAAKAAPPSLPQREQRPLQVPPPPRTGPPRRPLPTSPPHWNGPPATSPPTPAPRRRRTDQRPRP